MPLLNVLAEPTSIAVIVITSTLAASALFHRRNKAGISLLPPFTPRRQPHLRSHHTGPVHVTISHLRSFFTHIFPQ